jgi:hypothetical protein
LTAVSSVSVRESSPRFVRVFSTTHRSVAKPRSVFAILNRNLASHQRLTKLYKLILSSVYHLRAKRRCDCAENALACLLPQSGSSQWRRSGPVSWLQSPPRFHLVRYLAHRSRGFRPRQRNFLRNRAIGIGTIVLAKQVGYPSMMHRLLNAATLLATPIIA